MSNPVVVHIVRPYASEEEYILAEAWSIDSKAMFLIGGPELTEDTLVLFDIALANGHKPIRAEGKVIASLPAIGSRPAGLKVRFKRFGAATKAFIDRAVHARSNGGAVAKAPSMRAPAPVAAPPPVEASLPAVEASALAVIPAEAAAPAEAPPVTPLEETTTPAFEAATSVSGEHTVSNVEDAPKSGEASGERTSGVHRRTIRSVPAPPNREALLDRLRERGRVLLASGKLPTLRQDKTG